MNIVNITNINQAYIILSTGLLGLETQYVVLFIALALFIVSFIFSIIMLRKENISHIELNSTPKPEIKGSNLRTIKQNLLSAFSKLENIKQMISNLEDLKVKSIIDQEAYTRNKMEYDNLSESALSTINSIKADIKIEMESRQNSRAALEKSLEYLKKDYLANAISRTQYEFRTRNPRNQIRKIDREIAGLKSLMDSSGTYDILLVRD